MAESQAFNVVCEHLERATGLDRLAARGTVRLALKEAGLDPDAVTPQQMSVVAERVLPKELESLRISDVAGHCQSIRARLRRLSDAAGGGASPEAVFERLGARS